MNYSPADQIKNFLNYLETSGKNNLTIQNYQLYLKRFFDWLNKEKLSLDKIDYLAIQKYSRWLLGPAHSLKNNTVDYHLIALRSFSRYLKKTNQSGPTETDIKLNNAKTNESAWENDPADSLRQTIQQQTGAELIKLRDLCLVELLLNYGLKVSEISHLNKADLNLFKDQLTIRKNNSDETRTLTINSD
ncbi:MAG: tyrosine-type recombinase/integrase, partial [Patescibacteria group bacterium]